MFEYRNAQIFECLNRMLKCLNALKLASNTGVCSFACFFLHVVVLFVLKMLAAGNESTPTKHFVKNAKHLKIWRKEKATKM